MFTPDIYQLSTKPYSVDGVECVNGVECAECVDGVECAECAECVKCAECAIAFIQCSGGLRPSPNSLNSFNLFNRFRITLPIPFRIPHSALRIEISFSLDPRPSTLCCQKQKRDAPSKKRRAFIPRN